MVPGAPTVGMPNSSSKIVAPVNVPLPPMATRPSMPLLTSWSKACWRPSLVMNFWLRADLRMVPPFWTVLETEAESSLHKLALDHAAVAAHNAVYLNAVVDSGAHHGPNAAFMPGASPPLVKTAILFIIIKL